MLLKIFLAATMIATTAAGGCKWQAAVHTVPVHGYSWFACGPFDGTKSYNVKASLRSTVGDTYDFRFGQDGSKTPGPAHSYFSWSGSSLCESND